MIKACRKARCPAGGVNLYVLPDVNKTDRRKLYVNLWRKNSDIKKYNEQKAERFFEILQKTNASNIAEKYFLDKTKNDGTFDDFLSNFDDGCGNYGAAACLKEIIENIEGINISCDTVDGVQYLGLSVDTPWYYNEKTRNMGQKKYEAILMKYISCVTDEKLEIKYWAANDDCELVIL